MRPAVSIGRTTALDGFNDNLSNFGNDLFHQSDFGSYLEHPQPTESDNFFFENGIAPVIDQFDLNFDHMAGHNDSFTDDFNVDEFLIHDDNATTEIQPSDKLAQTTTSLQPQLGASS